MNRSLVIPELSKILSSYMPFVGSLDATDVYLLETVRQLLFAVDFGYLAQLMESMDVTAQAQQSLMEQRYEQGLIPETEGGLMGKRTPKFPYSVPCRYCGATITWTELHPASGKYLPPQNPVSPQKRHADAFISIVEVMVKGKTKGETDEPVTWDIKRLIRLPSSLHGKTGFEVVHMTRKKLDTFDPFEDAVPKSFGTDAVKVNILKPLSVTLRGEAFSLHEGQTEVPEFAAVYLVCRRLATVGIH